MPSDFGIFVRLGLGHITDLRGYDHMLFLAALAGVYEWHEWRRVVWLATAFTIGHSISLALSTLEIVRAPGNLVEVLIPITIVLTAMLNMLTEVREPTTNGRAARLTLRTGYIGATCFGLIHGLGFSTYLKSLLGKEASVAWELFGFNLGLEIGQIVIVILVLLLSFLVIHFTGLARRRWNVGISLVVAAVALGLLVERLRA